MASRNELVFRVVEVVGNRYRLTNVAAHASRALRRVQDSIPTSINRALSRIAGVEEPVPLPAPRWREMLRASIALRQAKQEAGQELPADLLARGWNPLSDDERKEIIALAAPPRTDPSPDCC